ncbi:MAG: YigZ family protein [Anaerolineae bacterium]|nr:YigZ family protein [Anaerolineae bacterium]
MAYPVPASEVRREIVVQGSRFIATLSPASSVGEAKAFVTRIRSEFDDATHNVPAYLVGGGNSIMEHASDDGEPSGTAGRPALAVLRGSGLGDVAVVVTRYFGGTKLGTGGLVRAYTQAVQEVVAAVPRAEKVLAHVALLVAPYALLERIRLLVASQNGELIAEDFAADVTLTLRFRVDDFPAFEANLQELSAGRLEAEIMETSEILYKGRE